LDLEANFYVIDKWFVYIGTSFYNYKDNATLFNNTINRDRWANYSVLSNDISFLKDNSLTANFTLTYIGKNVLGLQVVNTRWASDLSFRKKVFKGKGVFSLSFSDLFNTQDFFISTQFLNQNNTSFTNLDNRYVKLGFRYKFGNTKLSSNEHGTSIDERNRLGNKY